MKPSNIALAAVRLTGVTQVVLGVLFWVGAGLSLIPLHMAIGLTFVLSLWVFAGLAIRNGDSPGLAAFTILWGAVVIALGMTQTRLLPGPMHWIVRVLHLLVGIAAMGLAARLSQTTRRAVAPATQPSRAAQEGAQSGIERARA